MNFKKMSKISKEKIILTKEQLVGIDKINKFLSDRKSKKRTFIVTGAAGTGKTTIISHSLKTRFISYTATTHAATEVLRKAAGLTYKETSTIHSYLGLQLKTNSNGQQILKINEKSGKVCPGDNIIIDEGSMINKDLWSIINKMAQKLDLKIIIVGDAFQLPPINESTSISLKDPDIELAKIMRQAKNNPIISLVTKIRNGEKIDKTSNWDSKTKTGVRFLSKDEALKEMKKDFDINKTDKIRILAYTNKTVNYFNNIVREIIFGKKDELIFRNEFLISNSTHYTENQGQITTTSELLRVQKYKKDKWLGMLVLEIYCKGNDSKIKIVRCVPPESKGKYIKKFNSFLSKAKEAKIRKVKEWQMFYNFKSAALIMFSFKNGRQTEREGINYAYASTIHKAQGSTFDQIYLDTNDLKCCVYYENNSKDFYKKLLYTACTRPRLGLTIIK